MIQSKSTYLSVFLFFNKSYSFPNSFFVVNNNPENVFYMVPISGYLDRI